MRFLLYKLCKVEYDILLKKICNIYIRKLNNTISMKYNLIFFAIFLFLSSSAKANCLPGEVEVSITVHTDDYAYEGYWELVPSGNNCGTGTIFSGGNFLVGCNGGGLNHQNPGGYASDTVFTVGPFCLTQGASYDIIYVDDYGDGGYHFTIDIGGYPLYSALTASGDAPGSRLTFNAELPPLHDAVCNTIKNGIYIPYGNTLLSAGIGNKGTDTIHSIDFYYTPQQQKSSVNLLAILLLSFTSIFFHPL